MATADGDRVRVEDCAKRIRVLLGGEYVADSRQARLVWEKPYYPTYYIPAADVRTEFLVETGEVHHSSTRGDARVHTLKVGGHEAASAVSWFVDTPVQELTDCVRFDWGAMDGWFEEDEEVFVHPRDPYSRVDILQSSRHVRIEVDGVTVADSRQPRMLFETGLPPRYYLPKTNVRMDLLSPTDHTTRCPYKGTARYYSLRVKGNTHENLVWWYQHATHESAPIAGYVCFFNEHVDMYVDEVLQDRPQSPFSA